MGRDPHGGGVITPMFQKDVDVINTAVNWYSPYDLERRFPNWWVVTPMGVITPTFQKNVDVTSVKETQLGNGSPQFKARQCQKYT